MKLLDKIRDAFGFAPKLRNKPGGMALIRVTDSQWRRVGADAMDGHIVKTVRINSSGNWEIDPPQSFTATKAFVVRPGGFRFEAGALFTSIGIEDSQLQPLPEVPVSEVESLYAPGPRVKEAA